AVTPTAISSFELPARSVIDAEARTVYDLMTARSLKPRDETPEKRGRRIALADEEYPAAARRLAGIVLGPVAAALGTRRLVIIADGALQYVPFAALPVPQAAPANGRANSDTNTRRRPGVRPATENRSLLADHEIVNLPSATVLASLRQEASSRPPAAKALAVLADPVFQADDPRVSASPGARSRAEPSNREPESGISPAAHRKDLMPVRF